MKREEEEDKKKIEDYNLKKENINKKDEEIRLKLDEEIKMKEKKKYEYWIIFLMIILSMIIIEIIIHKELTIELYSKYDEMHYKFLLFLMNLFGKLGRDHMEVINEIYNNPERDINYMLFCIEKVFVYILTYITNMILFVDVLVDLLKQEIINILLKIVEEGIESLIINDFLRIVYILGYISVSLIVGVILYIIMFLTYMLASINYQVWKFFFNLILIKYYILDIILMILILYWLYKKLELIGDNPKKRLKLYKIILYILFYIILFYIILIIIIKV
jgi:hypothetical protein